MSVSFHWLDTTVHVHAICVISGRYRWEVNSYTSGSGVSLYPYSHS